MKLSLIGVLADVFWHEIKNHAEHIELGAFVVMPNHIHGILILDKPTISADTHAVETRHALSLPQSSEIPQKRFQNQGKNTVSSIIGSYKSAVTVTKHCNRLQLTGANDLAFGWQARFHDHIIRNDDEYQRINDYIENNPENWEDDRFFGDSSPL